MLDIKFVRNNIEKVKKALENRNNDTKILDELIKLDEEKRNIMQKVQELRAERNSISKNIAKLKSDGKHEEADEIIKRGKVIADEIKELDNQLKKIEADYEMKLYIYQIYQHKKFLLEKTKQKIKKLKNGENQETLILNQNLIGISEQI
jgi:seryl-tRNA synthetase